MSIEETSLVELEKNLENKMFLNGAHPSQKDAVTFAKFKNSEYVPEQDKYPSLWAWYSLMVLFEDEVIKSWKPAEMSQEKGKGKGKGEKKKPIDKSHVIMEIKGLEQEQDLETLAKKIINTIKKDGLQWNTGYKLEEVAFGIKKLVIAFLAEDNKVSVQEIVDELESWEDEIQSVDVVSFNKA